MSTGHTAAALGLTAIIVFAACDSADQPTGFMATDSAGIRIVTNDPLNSEATCRLDDEPMLVLGDDGGNEATWFSDVGGTGLLSDGSVAVIDGGSRQVRLFAADGRHLWTAGGVGEGPGEFDTAWYLWVLPGDTLWVADLSPWRYHVFTREGAFVRTVDRVTPYGNSSQGGGVLDSGTSINTTSAFISVRNFTVPDTLIIEAHGPEGEPIGTVARVPNMVEGTTSKSEALGISLVVTPVFTTQAMVDAGGGTIAIGQNREAEVRLFDDGLQLRSIVRWRAPGREVLSADVQAWRDSYVEREGGRDSDGWNEFDEVWVDPDRPASDVFPAFSRLSVARDGRLWVLPYRKPEQESPLWMAYQPDGTFFCHLARKPNFSVNEFGADYVLGVQLDELDVPTVVMYGLSRL